MIQIRIGGYAPQDSTHSRAVAHFAKRVDELAGDAATVDIMWNILDTGRPAADLLSMVEAGELTLCYFSSSYLGSRVPELNALEIPFLFSDLDMAHAALDGELGAWLTAATERQTGFEVLGYWDNGFRHFTNRLRPVLGPADVAGMRVRLQPNSIHEAMVSAWGGIPAPVDLSRGIELIIAGEVDAQENPLANTVAYGVDQVHGHVTMTGHLYGARGVYASREKLAAMPPEVATAIRTAAADAIAFQRSIAAAYERDLRGRLEAQGVSFVDLDEEGRSAFREATAGVVAAAKEELGGAVPWPT